MLIDEHLMLAQSMDDEMKMVAFSTEKQESEAVLTV